MDQRPAQAQARRGAAVRPRVTAASLLGALLLGAGAPGRADSALAQDALEDWSLDFDTGALFSFESHASALGYTFLPQTVTLRSGAVMRRELRGGTLVVRNRFSLLIQPIVYGPESYYAGVAGAPSIEWWNTARSWSAFFSIGGGFGWMDSQGYAVAGAQGQDFNFNWFVHAGVRVPLIDRLTAAAGVYFQHISNGGLDDVNPGVNALGPTIGIGWRF
jgi:hypothetical protein